MLAIATTTIVDSPGLQNQLEPIQADQSSTPRVLTILSSVLEKLVARNDRVVEDCNNYQLLPEGTANAGPATRVGKSLSGFQGVRAPSISIGKYLERLYKYSSCSPSCFVVGYAYIDRLLHKYPDSLLVSLNVHRLLVTAVMVASKMLDDVHCNNAFYARVGGVSNVELNRLELELLFLLDFGVTVSGRVFETYCFHLEREMLMVNPCASHKIERLLIFNGVDDATEISMEDNIHSSSPSQVVD